MTSTFLHCRHNCRRHLSADVHYIRAHLGSGLGSAAAPAADSTPLASGAGPLEACSALGSCICSAGCGSCLSGSPALLTDGCRPASVVASYGQQHRVGLQKLLAAIRTGHQAVCMLGQRSMFSNGLLHLLSRSQILPIDKCNVALSWLHTHKHPLQAVNNCT